MNEVIGIRDKWLSDSLFFLDRLSMLIHLVEKWILIPFLFILNYQIIYSSYYLKKVILLIMPTETSSVSENYVNIWLNLGIELLIGSSLKSFFYPLFFHCFHLKPGRLNKQDPASGSRLTSNHLIFRSQKTVSLQNSKLSSFHRGGFIVNKP